MELKYQPASILPIGKVNTKTGANKEYGSVFHVWKEDSFTAELWMQRGIDGGVKFMAVTTYGDESSNSIGERAEFRHDQTWRTIGNTWHRWEFVGAFKGNKEGLKELGLCAGQTRVPFYCYK